MSQQHITVPHALDQKILAAAKIKAAQIRFFRSFRKWSLSSAAAMAMLAAVVFYQKAQPRTEGINNPREGYKEWAQVEEKSYNLNQEIFHRSQSVDVLKNFSDDGGLI